MKHFISFLKRKGINVTPEANSTIDNSNLVLQINHELMTYGYILDKMLYNTLVKCDQSVLLEVYSDITSGLRSIFGGDGYEPIYRNFPQSVVNMSYREFAIKAIFHYWSFGQWRPEDAEYINREYSIEPVNYKVITLLSNEGFESIFTDLITSTASISASDKGIIDYFIDKGVTVNFSMIKFKEILAYIGKRLLDSTEYLVLPTFNATDVLRIYSAYCDGDEGLKENTKFKNPTKHQSRMLLATLDSAYNLEDSFKTHREKWLRLLYYLHPMDARNVTKYPNVAKYAKALRNDAKSLRTFNSRVEELLGNKDVAVFDLLKKNVGMFTRRLDHLVRIFGFQAFSNWMETKPKVSQLIIAYNHFVKRDKEQAGRSVILAGQTASNLTTFAALEPLDSKVVSMIKDEILDALNNSGVNSPLADKKVFIDRSLYYRPISVNNRASSFSADGVVNGSTEVLPEGKTIRMYVHWHGKHDIDLSGFIMNENGDITKVGWNANHHFNGAVVYSGDNTGYSQQNAEYLDITPELLPVGSEWVITEARIFRGPSSYSAFSPKTRVGWMLREKPEANTHWKPDTVEHAMVLNNQATTAFLMAYHVPTRTVVYLDIALGSKQVSDKKDAEELKLYLENSITIDDGSTEIKWDKINQGHVINLLAQETVMSVEEADVVFDNNTTYESIMSLL